MKHLYIILALAVLVLLAGCSMNTGKVQLGLNASNQEVMAINASGYLSADHWLETKSQQDLVETKAYFYKKATEATTVEESQKWLDLANQLSGGGSILIPLRNRGTQMVTVVDGPFAGYTLKPGQSTPSQRVPVGAVNFGISSTTSGGGNMLLTVGRTVKFGDTQIILADQTIYH